MMTIVMYAISVISIITLVTIVATIRTNNRSIIAATDHLDWAVNKENTLLARIHLGRILYYHDITAVSRIQILGVAPLVAYPLLADTVLSLPITIWALAVNVYCFYRIRVRDKRVSQQLEHALFAHLPQVDADELVLEHHSTEADYDIQRSTEPETDNQ